MGCGREAEGRAASAGMELWMEASFLTNMGRTEKCWPVPSSVYTCVCVCVCVWRRAGAGVPSAWNEES